MNWLSFTLTSKNNPKKFGWALASHTVASALNTWLFLGAKMDAASFGVFH
jgi:hypothetical protein